MLRNLAFAVGRAASLIVLCTAASLAAVGSARQRKPKLCLRKPLPR